MNKKYTLLGFFLLSILMLNITFGLASDDFIDEDLDGIDDDFEESNERTIELSIGLDEIQIESHQRNGENKDEIQLKIQYNNEGISIKVSYESEFETESIETEFELEFEVEFQKLIEFIDIDGNGMYDKDSNDQFIQEVLLNSFQPVNYTTQALSLDTTLHYLIINTTDGIFTAHIYFVEEFAYVDETLLTPSQAKIDIEISNFIYSDPSSQLALYVKLSSEAEYEHEVDHETDDEEDGYATDEDGIHTKSNGISGIFTWKENASVNGVVRDVLVSSLDVDDVNETEQKLLFNYPRGSHIYHDPKVGIVVGSGVTSILPIVLTGTIISMIGIAVVAVIVMKKRRIA